MEEELAAAAKLLTNLNKPDQDLLVRVVVLETSKHVAEARRVLANLKALRE